MVFYVYFFNFTRFIYYVIYVKMTTESRITNSLKHMFLSNNNVRDVTAFIGRNARPEMTNWSKRKDLDDYESVQMDYSEALDFANNEFVKDHKRGGYTLNMASGQDYPKYYIDEGVERYSVNDFRSHDAQFTQEVHRSSANFRYGNDIKKWETSLYKRNYDRVEHENGLRDIRELNTLQRGYRMGKIYGANDYESSDSIMYHPPTFPGYGIPGY